MPIHLRVMLLSLCVATWSSSAVAEDGIWLEEGRARLVAGTVERTIDLAGGQPATTSLKVAGQEMLAERAREFSVRIARAEPNRRPAGVKAGVGGTIDSVATFRPGKHVDPATYDDRELGIEVQWVEPASIASGAWSGSFDSLRHEITHPRQGVTRLSITAAAKPGQAMGKVTMRLCYEIYEHHPVVRKWIEVANEGDNWLRLDHLWIDDLVLRPEVANRTLLTPVEYGADASVVGFANETGTLGLIAGSEVPSALRIIAMQGAMGYRPEYFEWILGPGESFVSEPVFQYAFQGAVEKTASAESRPMDRTLEGPYMEFLHTYVGVAGDDSPYDAPQWLTWANFGPNLDDALIRQMADLAAKAGFVQFLIDDGWQQERLGTQPNTRTFPDFAATCKYIESRGLKLGLWLSCFRDPDSPDLAQFPDARTVPLVKRLGGFGMSFASPWRDYYVDDLVRLHDAFGVVYFKQDFSNIIYGDVGVGHEGRSRKDSLLRSLRRLLEVQDTLRRRMPNVTAQLTHEIYWDTPGLPCDLAVVKHVARYHVAPNACFGAYRPSGAEGKPGPDPAELRAQLRAGCLDARERFYSHRGLPVACLEFYGAATVNYRGSLTPETQDRQICSWLMGAPLVFSGDLSTLTEENLGRYRQRFELVKRLQDQYGIYQHFQFSGVPAPTDMDWHWWGKLNKEGCGAVVVVRGSGGAEHRAVNIPWVKSDGVYRVTTLLEGKPLGIFKGSRLQAGAVDLALAAFGQEILEVAPATSE